MTVFYIFASGMLKWSSGGYVALWVNDQSQYSRTRFFFFFSKPGAYITHNSTYPQSGITIHQIICTFLSSQKRLYAVVLPKSCEHTLMCKKGSCPLRRGIFPTGFSKLIPVHLKRGRKAQWDGTEVVLVQLELHKPL